MTEAGVGGHRGTVTAVAQSGPVAGPPASSRMLQSQLRRGWHHGPGTGAGSWAAGSF